MDKTPHEKPPEKSGGFLLGVSLPYVREKVYSFLSGSGRTARKKGNKC
jgi:hypothetical protein